MFTRKTQKKKVVVPTVETRTLTVPTAAGIKEAVVPAVASAAALAKSYSQEASDWAKPHLETGRELAEKQAAQAKDRMGEAKDRMGEAKDRMGEVKDLLGDSAKLSTLAATGAAAKGEAARRSRDAALVLQGKAVTKPTKKKGGLGKLFVNLGLLTALGAIVAVVVQKLTGPKDDPWARPLTDPYVAPPAGRDTTVAAGQGVQVTEVKDADAETAKDGEAAQTTEIIVPQGQVQTEGDKH